MISRLQWVNPMAPGKGRDNFQCVNFKCFSGVDNWIFAEKLLQDCSAISFDSGYGLVPSGNKPLPEPILIKFGAKPWLPESNFTYRKISNICRTKSQALNVYRLGLQLSLRNILKQGVEPRMKMSVLLQLHLSHEQFDCLLKCVLY